MTSDVLRRSLATASVEVDQSFRKLCTLLESSAYESRAALSSITIGDQLARFRIWAGNIGAFHQPPSTSSLDYRLREATAVSAQIHDHLDDLIDCLTTIHEIALGARPNRHIESEEDEVQSEGEVENCSKDDRTVEASILELTEGDEYIHMYSTEAEELFGTIKDSITGLFRLSMLIRRYSPRDRFAKALSGLNPFNEMYDITHVAHKFPKLDCVSQERLKVRLGKANTQRRRYLQYAREHRLKLSKDIADNWSPNDGPGRLTPIVRQQPSVVVQSEAGRTKTSGHPSTLALTAASTLLFPNTSIVDPDVEDSQSQASFATSLPGSENDDQSYIPSLDDASNGSDPFECPLCWNMQSIQTESRWKKHVLKDLRPYVCTFEDCDLKIFSNREDWFQHELSVHRKTSECPFCRDQNFMTPDRLRQHLCQQHSQLLSEDSVNFLVESSRALSDGIAPSECPFCDEWHSELSEMNQELNGPHIKVTPSQFKHHVGAHLQKLACFAIPRGLLQSTATEEDSATSTRAAGRASTEPSDDPIERRCISIPNAVTIMVYLQRWRSSRLILDMSTNSYTAAGRGHPLTPSSPKSKHHIPAGFVTETLHHLRSIPCLLVSYGCSWMFSSINEWKSHVSRHLRVGCWRCDLCAPMTTALNNHSISYYRVFNCKDTFMHHLSDIHGACLTNSNQTVEALVNEENIQEHEERCYVRIRSHPTKSMCRICELNFDGEGSWEEHLEHFGLHFEKSRETADRIDSSHWKDDIALEEYLLVEKLISWEDGTWKIGDRKPLTPASEVNAQRHVSDSIALEKPLKEPKSIIPYGRRVGFENDGTLERIKSIFETENRAALVGVAGTGKTRLALEYCYRERERLGKIWIFWLNARSLPQFLSHLKAVCESLGFSDRETVGKQSVALLKDWLDRHQPWILTIDNVWGLDVKAELARLLPVNPWGKVLLTARKMPRNLTHDFKSVIDLGSLTRERMTDL